jgi:hypothetical protein
MIKIHPFMFAEQVYILYKMLTKEHLLNKKLGFENLNIWDLLNPNIIFKTMDINKKIKLFLAYTDLIFFIFINNLKVHELHKLKLKSFLREHAFSVKYLRYKQEIKYIIQNPKYMEKGNLEEFEKYQATGISEYFSTSLEKILEFIELPKKQKSKLVEEIPFQVSKKINPFKKRVFKLPPIV